MTEIDDFSLKIRGVPLEVAAVTLLDRRNDPKVLMHFLAAESDWTFYGDASAWPHAGKMRNRDAILAFLTAFRVEFAQKSFKTLDVVVTGEQVCLRYRASYRHRGTGREAEIPGLAFLRVEGDQIVEAHEFCDSAQLLSLRDSCEA